MIYIDPNSIDATFYFAAEEYIMRQIPPSDAALLFWQIRPTIVIGRNQIAAAEFDLELAASEDVHIARRPSGGGAVYNDPGTLLCSIIVPWSDDSDAKDVARRLLVKPITDTLARLGVIAEAQGRNDITIDGRKISGVAQYICNGYICSHCSLLYDNDLDMMDKLLTVDEGKISSKALYSVRSRVANIREFLPGNVSIDDFKKHLISEWLTLNNSFSEYVFKPGEIEKIEVLRLEKYACDEWISGRTPPFTFTNSKRFPEGRVEVFLEVRNGRIANLDLKGDFLSLLPVSGMTDRLTGIPYEASRIRPLLESIDLKLYIGDINATELLSVLFQ